MKIFGNVVAVLIIAFGVVALGYIVYFSLQISFAVVGGAQQLEPEIYVPLTITVLTAIFGLSATLYTQVSNRKRDIDAAFRERKIEIYLDFLKNLERLLMSNKPELGLEPFDEGELVKVVIDFRTRATLWGSTDVLKAISQLGKIPANDTGRMFQMIEDIQRGMRKDLGLSNRGLGNMFFVKMILNDPSELDQVMNKVI